MKLSTSIVSLSLLLTGTLAAPATTTPLAEDNQTAHLTFRDDTGSYTLDVQADGKTVLTNSDMLVHLVDAPDYNARQACKFNTVNNETTISTTIAKDGVTQQVVFDPPTAILSVSCEGTCVTTYGMLHNFLTLCLYLFVFCVVY